MQATVLSSTGFLLPTNSSNCQYNIIIVIIQFLKRCYYFLSNFLTKRLLVYSSKRLSGIRFELRSHLPQYAQPEVPLTPPNTTTKPRHWQSVPPEGSVTPDSVLDQKFQGDTYRRLANALSCPKPKQRHAVNGRCFSLLRRGFLGLGCQVERTREGQPTRPKQRIEHELAMAIVQ